MASVEHIPVQDRFTELQEQVLVDSALLNPHRTNSMYKRLQTNIMSCSGVSDSVKESLLDIYTTAEDKELVLAALDRETEAVLPDTYADCVAEPLVVAVRLENEEKGYVRKAYLGMFVVAAANFVAVDDSKYSPWDELISPAESTEDSENPITYLFDIKGRQRYAGNLMERQYRNSLATYYALSAEQVRAAPNNTRIRSGITPTYVKAMAHFAIKHGERYENDRSFVKLIPHPDLDRLTD